MFSRNVSKSISTIFIFYYYFSSFSSTLVPTCVRIHTAIPYYYIIISRVMVRPSWQSYRLLYIYIYIFFFCTYVHVYESWVVWIAETILRFLVYLIYTYVFCFFLSFFFFFFFLISFSLSLSFSLHLILCFILLFVSS